MAYWPHTLSVNMIRYLVSRVEKASWTGALIHLLLLLPWDTPVVYLEL